MTGQSKVNKRKNSRDTGSANRIRRDYSSELLLERGDLKMPPITRETCLDPSLSCQTYC